MADLYNVAAGAYQAGRARAQSQRLNQLAQLAMSSPDQFGQIAPQMAGVDASAGIQLSGAIQERQLADQQRQRTRAAGFARYLQRIKDPTQRQQIAQVYGPKIGELPQDLSDQGLGAFIAASGQSMPTQGLTPSMQTLLAQRDLGLIDDEGLQTAINVLNRTEAGAAAPSYRPERRWNPVTKQEETVYVQTSGYQPGIGGPAAGMPQQMPPLSVAPPAQNIDAQMQEIGRRAQEMERSGVRPDVVQGFINAEMDRLRLPRDQGRTFDVPGTTATAPAMQAPVSSGTGFVLPTSAAAPASASFGELATQAGNVAAATASGRINTEADLAGRSAETARTTTAATETGRIEGQREAQPLPPEALAQVMDREDAISTASSLQNRLGRWEQAINDGQLQLSPALNLRWEAELASGRPSPQAINYREFLDELESIRNDVLRLNKGVQTEGDAQRAMNEIIANPRAGAYVMQRLKTLIRQNERAEGLQRKQIERIRQNYATPAQRESQATRYENDAGEIIEWNGTEWVEVN